MNVMSRRAALCTLLALGGGSLAAQGGPPDTLVNVQVIPKNTPRQQVLGMMRGFAIALGVRCTYCHVGQEGGGPGSMNYPSDEKRTKVVARTMLRMVAAINADYIAKLPDGGNGGLEVKCATCHRGVPWPIPLADLLTTTANAAGLDSAVRAYRALRDRYYGRAAYDFGEPSLMEAAGSLMRAAKWDEALGLMKLNEEQFPKSAAVQSQMGEYYRQRGDTASAVARFRMALERDPNDPQAQRMLRLLAPKP